MELLELCDYKPAFGPPTPDNRPPRRRLAHRPPVQQRINELAERANEGILSDSERSEYEALVNADLVRRRADGRCEYCPRIQRRGAVHGSLPSYQWPPEDAKSSPPV